MKKLTAKKKIRQIRMFKKNLKKMEKRKNKREKDKIKAVEKQRVLPRSRQVDDKGKDNISQQNKLLK